ncbi:FlgO family outer membrane protein [Planctobacterium marinum]|uniref:FlgO family outer membrane protein n=1 Tax=Planctobacterium marinum TaxID=1631968 RepID=UPI001E62C2ED|nr:FlgO family outer membrane protein [Planctobacterium marinum]MCC2605896.1 hypothetical protein [Planctobacterium marinum]
MKLHGYVLIAMTTLTAGCESTMASFQSVFSNSDDGEVIENPYQDDAPATKMNKSELEVAMSDTAYAESAEEQPHYMPPGQQKTQQLTAVIPVPRSSFQPAYTHKALSDYAEQMTMSLLQKTKHITPNSRIAIASFVEFNQALQSPSILGNRLAESFIAELQGYGLAVVDFKAMDQIQVTPQGDLFFERSGPRGDMQFVLTGTMHRSGRGVEVNVRIVNIYDKVTVATTKGFIPHFIVASLTPDYVLVDAD